MDIYGKALFDYYTLDKETETLWLHNSYDEPEEMPVDVFFRNEDEMPALETKALSLCKGTILDVGAGVGSHALILDQRGYQVTALDISPLAVQIMGARGVKNPVLKDFFSIDQQFDTLLFMMNGIGITGTLNGFEQFLINSKKLLKPKGQIIFDSSDISYLYEDLAMPKDTYYGEISYCYEYKTEKGEWFNWLYIDPKALKQLCVKHGWHCTIEAVDENDQYLAVVSLS